MAKPRVLAVRLFSLNEEQDQAKWRKGTGWVSIAVLDLAAWFGRPWTLKLGYEPEGREFESLRAHHSFNNLRRWLSI